MQAATRALIIVAGLGAPAMAEMTQVGEVVIHDPWVRASLGEAPNSAAYMRLETTAAQADRLIGGASPAAQRVELHTHVMEGGVAKMRPVEAIEVGPGAPAVLAPGGLHVMLIGLTGSLDEGTTMPLTLRFEAAGEVTLEVPVKGMQAGMRPREMDHETMGDGERSHDGSN